jgi:hypothetical protein
MLQVSRMRRAFAKIAEKPLFSIQEYDEMDVLAYYVTLPIFRYPSSCPTFYTLVRDFMLCSYSLFSSMF